jgi:hypothetical protein
MPKSASTLLQWYTRELLAAYYPTEAQRRLRALTDGGALTGIGGYIGILDRSTVARLLEISSDGPVVVKTHHRLTPLLRDFLKRGDAKATFCHRDPRDVILAGIDHRTRFLQKGKSTFEEFTSVQCALEETRQWCRMTCRWVDSGLACVFRYTDVVAEPKQQLARLADYLQVPAKDEVLQRIVDDEQKRRARGRNQFNRGALTRYHAEMDPRDICHCERRLGRYMRRLGYPTEMCSRGIWAKVLARLPFAQT